MLKIAVANIIQIIKALNTYLAQRRLSKSEKFGTSAASNKESFLNGDSKEYIEDMYKAWLRDPSSVHASWDAYFRERDYQRPPTLEPVLVKKQLAPTNTPKTTVRTAATAPSVSNPASPKEIDEHLNVQAIIRSYQVRGHLVARTNPLYEMFDINDKTTSLSEKFGKSPPEVIRYHKIESSMMNTPFLLPESTRIGGSETSLPLKEIVKRLELAYCRHIGIEYMYINDVERCNWLREHFEVPGVVSLNKAEKRLLLTRLARAVLFEKFLQRKWPSEKRFGIEGCEIMIPCIKTIIDTCSQLDGEMIILGMAHRGRLNVLANICRKPLKKIFAQFHGLEPEDEGSGDVKYHLGVYAERKNNVTNKMVKIVLVANPSHLEEGHSVCQGRVRAEQFYLNDDEQKKVIPILMHGDAAFCGEGICYETINLSNLTNYKTGGTIHIVVNNQIGFTTDPRFSRSAPYCTDIAKVVNAPVFHVNSDDPESAIYVSKIAAMWRQKFKTDVVIDIVCYRKHGHNEADEPMFTQPVLYTKIKGMKNVWEKYCEAAKQQGIVTDAEINAYRDTYDKICELEFAKAAKETTVRFGDWIDSPWKHFFKNKDMTKCEPTGVSLDVIKHIATKFSTPPPGDFLIHKNLQRILRLRMDMVKNETIDWALGEALTFGSLLKEGVHVRLSGEDVERGTFSHRHHVLHHQTKDKTRYTYLRDLYPDQASYTVSNSPISEYGVLGFEHGYSMVNPHSLIIWEAQFGDFANNGQTMFDTMICSGQSKWIRQCGMVCLLPHGLEGTEFQRLIPCKERASENPDNVKKLIFCTGKIYYDFMKLIKDQKLDDKIAIARVEQMCPFPYDLVVKECNKYKNAKIAWGQEEHKNSGCWMYMHPRFETALKGKRPILYNGRPPSASTASGNKIQYQKELKNLMASIIALD
ncbi:2-oxoglutarate dehydrogenase, mitochondrial-like isoform X2 [Sitophilus oryzae]|uniref:2-oxoglutarate dehydrogenase, mitochondrial n=1 Tax=Sitophilus oryzae TaxID=7048 RepID=A0A6J2XAG7_SITOR|nr:2-oxoglutarate dehydrogenase, mitochondrial-like isoform X2 [Sitophilus oryzae]